MSINRSEDIFWRRSTDDLDELVKKKRLTEITYDKTGKEGYLVILT